MQRKAEERSPPSGPDLGEIFLSHCYSFSFLPPIIEFFLSEESFLFLFLHYPLFHLNLINNKSIPSGTGRETACKIVVDIWTSLIDIQWQKKKQKKQRWALKLKGQPENLLNIFPCNYLTVCLGGWSHQGVRLFENYFDLSLITFSEIFFKGAVRKFLFLLNSKVKWTAVSTVLLTRGLALCKREPHSSLARQASLWSFIFFFVLRWTLCCHVPDVLGPVCREREIYI